MSFCAQKIFVENFSNSFLLQDFILSKFFYSRSFLSYLHRRWLFFSYCAILVFHHVVSEKKKTGELATLDESAEDDQSAMSEDVPEDVLAVLKAEVRLADKR